MRGKIGSLVLCALLVTSGCLEKSPPDMDGDGIHDSEDADMDGDGWENSVELSCSSTDFLNKILVQNRHTIVNSATLKKYKKKYCIF